MPARVRYQLVGLATAVHAVVARVEHGIEVDGAVPGDVRVGRGGMVCNTLAVAAALGARVGGVVASGADPTGTALREVVVAEGVQAAFVATASTPTTVTLAQGATRSSVMGVDGAREQHLVPADVAAAWRTLHAHPTWVLLTLPALDSPAGAAFTALARMSGAAVAVTLSSARQVVGRAGRARGLLADVDLVFGNAGEVAALRDAGVAPRLVLATCGAQGAEVLRGGAVTAHVPIPELVPVVDTTGAGDSFAAGVLSRLDPRRCSDGEVGEAVTLGHRAAGVMVGRLGAEPGEEGSEALRRLGRRSGL
jgi:sugar/nucleoside kinase (ribokinase family)